MNTRRFVIVGMSAAVVLVTGGAVLNLLPAHGLSSPAAVVRPLPNGSGDPGAAGTPGKRLTTEVLPPKPSVPVLPRSKPLPPLFTGPIPRSASAQGRLVAGFPAHLPVIAGSLIKNSSVSSSNGKMQVTLDATSARSPQELVAYFQSALGKYGLSSTALPAVGGSTALAFSQGSTSITLTVTSTGARGSRYLLFGVLSPQS